MDADKLYTHPRYPRENLCSFADFKGVFPKNKMRQSFDIGSLGP